MLASEDAKGILLVDLFRLSMHFRVCANPMITANVNYILARLHGCRDRNHASAFVLRRASECNASDAVSGRFGIFALLTSSP